ncbi:hypothetical protein NMY22_g9829 [Coprinellus aureogranulatus]|nr:hypothetical protein NMY22_g9829 [Coprinellus aureogranulatus]
MGLDDRGPSLGSAPLFSAYSRTREDIPSHIYRSSSLRDPRRAFWGNPFDGVEHRLANQATKSAIEKAPPTAQATMRRELRRTPLSNSTLLGSTNLADVQFDLLASECLAVLFAAAEVV